MSDNNSRIKLIVGLGNPTDQYSKTRHNAGFWFIEKIAETYGGILKKDKNFLGKWAKIFINKNPIYLLCPHTFMNKSGSSVKAIMNFYKITVDSILVVHDDLDIPVGKVKFKQGGGNGGHNGIKDIIAKLGQNPNFLRLRIGISRPANNIPVDRYVLANPSKEDKNIIENCIKQASTVIEDALDVATRAIAIQKLHS